jgi:hypothetical protein
MFSRRREDGSTGEHPRYVFVVTYGRSGSTLTQGLLNALPGTLVRGENNMFMLPFFRAWSGFKEFQEKNIENARRKGTRSAFYGIDEVDPDAFIEATRSFALEQLYGRADRSKVDVLGFKEVLWHRVVRTEVDAFFDWFEMVFPDAHYVLNQRDHASVKKSGFWQNHDDEQVDRILRRTEGIQRFLRRTRPDRTHDIRYERITSDDPAVSDAELRGLAEFVVGRGDKKVLMEMRRTLGEGHGPRPFGRSHESDDDTAADSSARSASFASSVESAGSTDASEAAERSD